MKGKLSFPFHPLREGDPRRRASGNTGFILRMNNHQLNQLKVIGQIEDQINSNSLSFTTVAPVDDYTNDPRMALTSVHFPNKDLIHKVQKIISSLKEVEPDYYYYPDDSLHMTIKNIRVINDPQQFDDRDIFKVREVFSQVIPNHSRFDTYFYRLLLFPNNLALVGTTDSELDQIILHGASKVKAV